MSGESGNQGESERIRENQGDEDADDDENNDDDDDDDDDDDVDDDEDDDDFFTRSSSAGDLASGEKALLGTVGWNRHCKCTVDGVPH